TGALAAVVSDGPSLDRFALLAMTAGSPPLIPPTPIHQMQQRLAAFERLDLPGDEAGHRAWRGDSGVVRADEHVRVAPEARVSRQRLGLEHVERGGLQHAGVERGEDVGFDLQ